MAKFIRLFGRLLLAVLASYVGVLVYLLFDAYFLDPHNLTSASYYFEEALWNVFILPFLLIYSVWGLPVVGLQLFLIFHFLRETRLTFRPLLLIAILYTILSWVNDGGWKDGRQISCGVLSVAILTAFYFAIRWWTKRRSQRLVTTDITTPPLPYNTVAAGVLTATFAGIWAYAYTIYWPNKQLANLEFLHSARPEQLRNVCHRVLSHSLGAHHDAFILLSEVGTEESVPYLISALQWQPETTSSDKSMICTKAHCLGALIFLTNQNPGSNYSDWAKWWESNKKKNRREWMLDGYRQKNFPVTDPPDDVFVEAIISAIGARSVSFNGAIWFLKQIPKDQCVAAVDRALHSPQVNNRRGAIECVVQMEWPNAEAKISSLRNDPDSTIRKSVEIALKGLARQKNPVPGTSGNRF